MFSGIVETASPVVSVQRAPTQSDPADLLRIEVERPAEFDDLQAGHSVAVNGICLTVESLPEAPRICFALGPETLRVTGWDERLLGERVNLERSLRWGERIHGHMVSGHVDGVGQVIEVRPQGECIELAIEAPEPLRPMIWSKGSIAVQGVSLTLNRVFGKIFEVCLIPETCKRTNLGSIATGSQVNLEADPMARALLHVIADVKGKTL